MVIKEAIMSDTNQKQREIPGMFEGPIVPLLIKLSVPILAGALVGILYNVVDALFISLIDKEDPSLLAGPGLVFPILFLAMSVSNGLQVGVSALVARSIGEKKRDILDKVAESGLICGVTLSVILLVVCYLFDDEIIGLLGGEGDVFQHGLDYFRYIVPTGLFLFFTNVLNGILQGEGQVKKVMNAMIIATAANLILDPIFIFALGLGVKGGALATTIAQFISFLYVVSVFLRNQSDIKIHWKLSNIDFSIIKKIFYVGIPQSFSMMMIAFSFMFLNSLVMDIGQNAMTAFTISGRIEQMIMMPIIAIGSAVVTTIGQNAGRGNYKRVRELWKNALLLGFGAVAIMATILFITSPFIYPNFSAVKEVVNYSITQTQLFGFCYLFAVVSMIAFNVFQAVHKPMPGFLLTILRMILIAVPAAYFYVNILDLGMMGVWLGLATGNIVSAILSFFWTNSTLKKVEIEIAAEKEKQSVEAETSTMV